MRHGKQYGKAIHEIFMVDHHGPSKESRNTIPAICDFAQKIGKIRSAKKRELYGMCRGNSLAFAARFVKLSPRHGPDAVGPGQNVWHDSRHSAEED